MDDPELITSDKQRIGLQVSADVFRPHETDLVTFNYARYRGIYTDDIKETDKMIFTPEGVFPNLIFNNGAVPSFNVTNP